MIHINGLAKSELSNVQDKDVQPNATDLRIQKIFRIRPNLFTIDESQKIHRGSDEIIADPDGYWNLKPGTYEVLMDNTIKVAEGEDGFVITRSTLNRNGVFITSGLYDSGYNGVMAAAIHITCGDMKIQKGTRIGQYLCFKAETLHQYNGDYGLDKKHDKKYS